MRQGHTRSLFAAQQCQGLPALNYLSLAKFPVQVCHEEKNRIWVREFFSASLYSNGEGLTIHLGAG